MTFKPYPKGYPDNTTIDILTIINALTHKLDVLSKALVYIGDREGCSYDQDEAFKIADEWIEKRRL